MSAVKASCKLVLFFLWTGLLLPPQFIVFLFTRGPMAYEIPYIWECGVCRLFGIKVITKGTPYTKSQTLYVSNHLSYLDIPAIASILKFSFVAKADVEKWPVFGFLSKMQQTAFISRRPSDAAKGKFALATMLADGKSLIIFPEGTSTDGQTVKPFKSSLFSIALESETKDPLMVQPLTVHLQEVGGQKPVTQALRDLYAWHGDMTLAPHLWAFLKSSGATVCLRFHPPVAAASFTCRKELAKTCHLSVEQGLVQAT